MYRVSLANVFTHRTLKPLQEKTQATPVAGLLGTSYGVGGTVVYSGMVAALDTDGSFKIGANGTVAYGLFALDSNATIDDLDGQPSDLKYGGLTGVGRPFAVWQGGPDAVFQIDTPAWNNGGAPSVGNFLYPDAAGKLAVSGQNSATNADWPAAQVIEVVSTTRLVIRVMLPTPGKSSTAI